MSNRVPTSPFEITRRDGDGNVSATYTGAAARGFALGAHATDEAAFDMAQHNTFQGHLTRDVVVGGISLSDRLHSEALGFRPSDTGVVWEWPFTAGEEVSVTKARELELEGANLVQLSGTGAIDTNTAVGAKLSFLNGRLRVSQSGEIVNYVLTANNLTPFVTGALRIRCEAQ